MDTSDGACRVIISVPLNMPGCYISQSISGSELQGQRTLFLKIIGAALVGIVAVGLFLMMLMDRMIHTPVARLRDKIRRIAQGDFSREPSIEWDHELGDIGKGINDLSESVTSLMNKRIEDEKQKQGLEYKMLQSQINPYFIYNTLSSIKWMATIQGADGIAENSIFHGIEPKGGTGRVTVRARYEDGGTKHRNIRIDVTDNGVGISPEKAAQILTDSNDSQADFFREIGVSNVHKRLQYEFGNEYGITVESIVGEYTTMSILIPEASIDVRSAGAD